ncbi:unnamed protein product [Phytophthora lilii]|uniref:Unnamed protein product n=1 Tax=Phytophthora lilii TaxID=2077276 RepID=A0A9W6UCX0_9STRA|nr:unnamed protein product [Phytophthora lilii]
METWCRTHVSDHSGWNHRQHTLNVLTKLYQDSGDKRDAVRSLILAEYKFVSDIMTSYPTHEALWCNRRYVVQWLLNQMAGEVASSDLAAICDLISRASATLLKEKPGSVEATALHTSWDDIFMSLSSDAVEWSSVRAIFYEIESAWNYDNQFSRRYAVWCLARLRVFLCRRLDVGERDPDVALTRELGSLASSLHAHLVQKDPVLKDLWLCV